MRWILENLDCTVLPVCLVNMHCRPARRLLQSLWRPLIWRLGQPAKTKDLMDKYKNSEEAEKFLVNQIIDLSEGNLRIELEAEENIPGDKKA